ncbi:MAG TPA: periplasmic heavy metal sensor [Thermoanaerobaculia bacterium]|nr:periplasmic heavy metal sensor [Thermoanaerobaculia bacterium]
MRNLALLFLLALLPAAASAQAGGGGDDPFARYLFPPDRIMSHSLEIGLEDAQKTAIRNEVQKAQPKFTDAQFELQAEGEKMIRLLQEKPVDETRVLAQVDRILAVEKEIKKTQITLLVRIKNVLTPAQQAKLTEIPKAPGK